MEGAGVAVGVVENEVSDGLLPKILEVDLVDSPIADAKPLPNMEPPSFESFMVASSSFAFGSGVKLDVSLNGVEPNGCEGVVAGFEAGAPNGELDCVVMD